MAQVFCDNCTNTIEIDSDYDRDLEFCTECKNVLKGRTKKLYRAIQDKRITYGTTLGTKYLTYVECYENGNMATFFKKELDDIQEGESRLRKARQSSYLKLWLSWCGTLRYRLKIRALERIIQRNLRGI